MNKFQKEKFMHHMVPSKYGRNYRTSVKRYTFTLQIKLSKTD